MAVQNNSFSSENFRHPTLSEKEHNEGARLGIDSWADTACAGKHAFVEEFIIGKYVNASGFSSSLGSLKRLPVANVLYAYDAIDGTVLVLESNNSIYMGDKMNDSLLNPIQAEEVDVRIDIRPKRYYSDPHAQTISFSDGTTLPVLYHGVLPYIPIRRPTQEEIHSCRRLSLSSKDAWDPFLLDGSFCKTSSRSENDLTQVLDGIDRYDPIASELMSTELFSVLSMDPLLRADGDTFRSISSLTSKQRCSLSPEELSKQLHIGLATASRTLKATTHQFIRTTGSLTKRFRTDKAQLRYKQLAKVFGSFYCAFLKVEVKSVRGYVGGVMYTNKASFYKFVPCSDEKGQETGRSFRYFLNVVGLPFAMHSDNHSNFKDGLFKKLLRKFGVFQTFTEPHSPWQNRAEPAIGEVKRYARKIMQATETPVRLWCFCYEYSADLLSLLANGRFDLQGRTPYEVVMHYTPDISEYVSFSWFQWCYYFDEQTRSKRLCRWLGPAHQVGQSFCFYLLLDNAEFIARSTVIPVPEADLESNVLKEQMTKFMRNVNERIGNAQQPSFDAMKPNDIYYNAFHDLPDDDQNILPYGDELTDVKVEEINNSYLDSLDEYIGAEVVIPDRNAIPVLAKVKKRKRDSKDLPIGEKNDNPILDTRIYELEFPDGRVEEYSVNVLAENLLNQADQDGWDSGLLSEIIGLRRDGNVAVSKENGTFTTTSGMKRNVITTKGWDVNVKWKDQSTSWIPLSDMKEANPIEVAEYAIANGYNEEPAFKWWVKKALRHRDRMISRLHTRRCRKGRMKFGIEVPGTVEEALRLDEINGNTLWRDAINKEMKNSKVAFELLGRGDKAPVGFKEITCHLIFDIKLSMERKARYVAGGHLTDVPSHMTYSSVVSRDTVRIGFLIAALNGLEILAGDIQNAFLSAPTKEKVFFYAGDEWKADKDRIVVVVRALYGLKSSALQFRNYLAETLANKLGFKSSLADPDLWYKPTTAPDGFEYYSYILVYCDDLLIIDKDPGSKMEMIKTSFTVKPSSIGEPTTYLGANINKVYYPDGSYAWTMGSQSYLEQAIKNLKK